MGVQIFRVNTLLAMAHGLKLLNYFVFTGEGPCCQKQC